MKGILFTPKMAVAACEGRKTQTRRVIVPQPDPYTKAILVPRDSRVCSPVEYMEGREVPTGPLLTCDYQTGERRCLLTTWAVNKVYDSLKPKQVAFEKAWGSFWHAGIGTPKPAWAGKSRPGRFLPNHLRPLMPVFEVASVDAERVQDISDNDAIAEGVDVFEDGAGFTVPGNGWTRNERDAFRQLWDSINAEPGPVAGENGSIRYVSYPWDGRPETKTHRGQPWTVVPNPWTWVIAFRRVEA